MTIPVEEVSLLLKAIHFAAKKHKGQRRKDPEATPYINHPIEVAQMLWNEGKVYQMKVIVAAILHDTIEDTKTTAEELEKEFGKEISQIVQEVTDDKSLPKVERKRLQIEHAGHISKEAQQVKLSDKISNVSDLSRNCPNGWDQDRCFKYVDWAEKVISKLRGVNEILEKKFDESCEKAREHIKEL